jgi:hypothetical protein
MKLKFKNNVSPLTPLNEEQKLKININETTKKDWLSWAILISAFLLGGYSVLTEIGKFLVEQEITKQEIERQAASLEYQYNVQNETITPHQVYADTRQALLNGDVDKVLELLHPSVRHRYEPGLRRAEEEGILHEAAERMTPLTEIIYEDDFSIVYQTKPIPGNEDSINPLEGYKETVEFTRDRRGFWKISSI